MLLSVLGLLSLMFLSSISIGQVNAQDTFISVQNDQTRFVRKHIGLDLESRVLRGMDGRSIELMYSTSSAKRMLNITRGVGNVTFPTLDTVEIHGSGNQTATVAMRFASTFMQKDEYIEGVEVGKRIHRSNHSTHGGTPVQVDFYRVFNLPATYDDLDSNSNYTKREHPTRNITVFILRWGELVSVPLNDSDGNEIGKVFAFRFHLHIAAFDSESKEFLANYESFEMGYGNMVPRGVLERAQNSSTVQRRAHRGAIGAGRANATTPVVEWINLGMNETLGLNMSLGIFGFHRRATATILAAPRSRSQGLAMQQLSFDIESLIDSYAAANEFSDLDTDSIDSIDQELVDEAVSVVSFNISEAAGGRLAFNPLFFVLPFIIAIPIYRKRFS